MKHSGDTGTFEDGFSFTHLQTMWKNQRPNTLTIPWDLEVEFPAYGLWGFVFGVKPLVFRGVKDQHRTCKWLTMVSFSPEVGLFPFQIP